MTSKTDIINEIARNKQVERMVQNIAHKALTQDLQDLVQMVYMIMLEYDEEKLQNLWECNQINFFIARIIINQYRSCNSPYHYLIRRYQEITKEINNDTDKQDCR